MNISLYQFSQFSKNFSLDPIHHTIYADFECGLTNDVVIVMQEFYVLGKHLTVSRRKVSK